MGPAIWVDVGLGCLWSNRFVKVPSRNPTEIVTLSRVFASQIKMIWDLQVFWIILLCFGRAYLRWRFSIGDCAVQPFFLNHCLSIVLFVGEDVQFDPHVCLNSSNHHLPIDFCWIELPLKGVTFLQFLYGDRLEARWCDPWCYRYIREARVVLSKCNSLMNLCSGWLNWRARKDNLTFKAGHLRFNATIDDVL